MRNAQIGRRKIIVNDRNDIAHVEERNYYREKERIQEGHPFGIKCMPGEHDNKVPGRCDEVAEKE